MISAKILEENGFFIKAIGINYAGILEAEVIDIAIRGNRLIMTFDRDNGKLIFKRG